MVTQKRQAAAIASATFVAGCIAHSVRNYEPAQVARVSTLPAPTPETVQHLLARFTFGATPRAAAEVRRLGIERWFDAQLSDTQGVGSGRVSPYAHALGEPEDVMAAFRASEDTDPVDTDQISLRKQARRVNVKALLATVGAAQVQRQIESEAQLHALMVDFWSNHFNVFARKNALKVLAGSYVESVIVPHALGRFEDLLIATAQSPAMLVYLDNDKSVAEQPHAHRGLNENYARELLELHTLGVNAGYSQADVIDVARILTGFGLGDPREQGLSFEFSAERHDRGAKRVLGRYFPAGVGQEEGLDLLRFLARHPATAEHIAQKLCQRFISDDPSAACVAAVANTFSATSGDVPATLRSLLHLPGFWDPSTRGAKLKKPSEFLASAARALGLTLDGTPDIAKVSEQLGEPALLYPAPTGYPDRASAWAGSSQILARMDVAARLVSGQIPGVNWPGLGQLLPPTEDHEQLLARINALVFGGLADRATLQILNDEASRASSPEEARTTALALALGSPAFQRR
jgi:uncharacterized protein (DUF1800 family)